MRKSDIWVIVALLLLVFAGAVLLEATADGQSPRRPGPVVGGTENKVGAHYRHHGRVALNDRQRTPGSVDPALTAEKLCDPKFHTGTVRNVTETEKRQVCAAYGVATGCPGAGFEIDHLISIELGGANDVRNLWPQPVDADGVEGFHTKDKLENHLHKMVCAGTMPLRQAQLCISRDWVACESQAK
jgi:hypothetical protein